LIINGSKNTSIDLLNVICLYGITLLLSKKILVNGGEIMPERKTRSDCTVGTFEKKTGVPPGTVRNTDGRDTRSDKLIGTIRKEYEDKGKKNK
jgi:hypothetical protein